MFFTVGIYLILGLPECNRSRKPDIVMQNQFLELSAEEMGQGGLSTDIYDLGCFSVSAGIGKNPNLYGPNDSNNLFSPSKNGNL